MKQKEINSYIEKGYVHINTIFEIIGKPKEHIERTLKAYLENIKQDTTIVVLEEDYEKAEEIEDGLFSVMVEVEFLMPDFEKISWLCINFSPASVEILNPKSITLDQKTVTHWINDLLSRLHEIGAVQKSLQSQTNVLIKNFNAMTRNAILQSLKDGPEKIDEISKKIGMPPEHSKQFLEALIKEEKIKLNKNKYERIENG